MPRLLQVFVSPIVAYGDVARRPAWLTPFVAALVVAFCAHAVIFHVVGFGPVIRNMLPDREGIDALALRVENSVALQSILYAAPVVTTTGAICLIAGAYAVLFLALGTASDFRRLFSVGVHSLLVYYAFSYAVLLSVVLLTADRAAFNLADPLVSSAGAFLDPEAVAPFLFGLASSIDVFSAVLLGWLGTGYRVVCRDLSGTKVWTTVLGTWAVYVVVKSTLAAFAS